MFPAVQKSHSRPRFTRRNPKYEAREGQGDAQAGEGDLPGGSREITGSPVKCIKMLTAYTLDQRTSLFNSVGGSISAVGRRSRIARFLKNGYAVSI